MKIGIVTIYNVTNYGALMQCFALCQYLKGLGHNPFLFNLPLSELTLAKRLKREVVAGRLIKFIPDYLPTQTDDLETKADLYLVGSDQVWNLQLTGDKWDKYMLSFAPTNARRAAFAASFGTDKWNFPEYTEKAKQLLTKFDKIAVREESGGEILKSEFGLESVNVLDPCFLLDDYASRFGLKEKKDDKIRLTTYRLCYTPKWHEDVKRLASSRGYLWTELAGRHLTGLNDMRGLNVKTHSIKEWLQSIYSADYVITDSFHGMVFCLLFKRQFAIVPGVKGRSSRLLGLLSKLGLQDRYKDNLKNAIEMLSIPINYEIVSPMLEILRQESLSVLQSILK